jgi:hypothetical protein
MSFDPAWGPVLAAAQRGDLPLVKLGQSAVLVGKSYGGAQPVYLATPYTKECIDVLGEWSYDLSRAMQRRAERAAADLHAQGVSAFAPVALSAGIVHATGEFHHRGRTGSKFKPGLDPLDAVAWARWCQPFLNVCGAVVVPDLPGWDRSRGIWQEVQFAVDRGIPVFVYYGVS